MVSLGLTKRAAVRESDVLEPRVALSVVEDGLDVLGLWLGRGCAVGGGHGGSTTSGSGSAGFSVSLGLCCLSCCRRGSSRDVGFGRLNGVLNVGHIVLTDNNVVDGRAKGLNDGGRLCAGSGVEGAGTLFLDLHV